MMIPKPKKKEKENKSYNSLQRKKPKKEIAPWRKDILSSHQPKPSKADRAEFSREIVQAAIERSGGKCQRCKVNVCTTTHHVWGRGRGGRGVLSNAYRACGVCHIEIESNNNLKEEIIEQYRQLYGDYFYFDDQDWEEFNRKQAAIKAAEDEKKERLNQIKPIVELITTAAGRSLKAKELRLLEGFDEREMTVFASMISDVVAASQPSIRPSYAYGERFED